VVVGGFDGHDRSEVVLLRTRRGDGPIERQLHRFGRHRVAIAERHVITQVQRQRERIIRILPRLCGGRLKLAITVGVDERVEDRTPDVALRTIVQLRWVERVGRVLHTDRERRGRILGRLAPGRAARACRQCGCQDDTATDCQSTDSTTGHDSSPLTAPGALPGLPFLLR